MITSEEAFKICAGNLGNLPGEYKKWKTMQEYRATWKFLNDILIRENVCENHMAFHYLYSIGLWLNPGLTIRIGHNLLCLQTVASIYEAVLFDLLSKDISDSAIKEEMSYWKAGKVMSLLFKKKLMNEPWSKKISSAQDLRNCIHLHKSRYDEKPGGRNRELELFNINVRDLDQDLNSFVLYIRKKYN